MDFIIDIIKKVLTFQRIYVRSLFLEKNAIQFEFLKCKLKFFRHLNVEVFLLESGRKKMFPFSLLQLCTIPSHHNKISKRN